MKYIIEKYVSTEALCKYTTRKNNPKKQDENLTWFLQSHHILSSSITLHQNYPNSLVNWTHDITKSICGEGLSIQFITFLFEHSLKSTWWPIHTNKSNQNKYVWYKSNINLYFSVKDLFYSFLCCICLDS